MKTDTKQKQEIWQVIRSILLFIMVVFLSYAIYAFGFRRKTEPPVGITWTNRSAVYHTTQGQADALKSQKDIYRLAIEGREEEKNLGMYVIPGLRSTRTLFTEEVGKIEICSSMVPQGVAVTEDYLLITAYCATKRHNSVLYVVGKKNHKLIKTVVLPGKPHAGGVAYDWENHRIWYSSHAEGIAQAVSITLEDLERYNFEEDSLPIKASPIFLIGVIRDSFLTIYNGYLYVGYFANTSEGTLVKYKVNKDGGIAMGSQETLNLGLGMAIPETIGQIPSCVQGIAFYDGCMLTSQSYGILHSSLSVFRESAGMWYTDGNLKKMYDMPERMEQICVEGDQLYVLFESAAYSYQASSANIIDRVLKIDLKKVKEEIESEKEFQKMR